jgi:hypothetical protein
MNRSLSKSSIFKLFGKTVPDTVLSVKERSRLEAGTKVGQTAAKQQRSTRGRGC